MYVSVNPAIDGFRLFWGHQAIIWNKAVSLIGALGTNSSEIFYQNTTIFFEEN